MLFDAYDVEVAVVRPHPRLEMERKCQNVGVVGAPPSNPPPGLGQGASVFLSLNHEGWEGRDGKQHGLKRQPNLAGKRVCVFLNLGHGAGRRHDLGKIRARENQRRVSASCCRKQDVSVCDEPHAASCATTRSPLRRRARSSGDAGADAGFPR